MEGSIIGNYYDLLSYYGSGNYHRLERCYAATCRGESVNIDGENFSLNRKRAIRFLNTFGLIEIDYQASEVPWVVCPGFLVFKGPSKIICIGGSVFIDKFLKEFSSPEIDLLSFGYQPTGIPSGVEFFPKIPHAKCSLARGKELSEILGCRLIESPSESILSLLPSMKEMIGNLAEPMQGFPFEEDLEIFVNEKFIKLDKGKTPSNPCLLRKQKVDGRYEYYVLSADKFERKTYRVNANDWAMMIGYYLIDGQIPVQYDKGTRLIHFPRFLQLPILFERFLIGNSFIPPQFNIYGSRTYLDIPESFLKTLQEKMPIFYIKVTT